MTTDVVVTGIGLQSCLGDLTNTWNGILAKKTGIRLDRPFSELPAYPLGKIAKKQIDLGELTQIIVKDVIESANLQLPLIDCGLVIGSSRGCQGIWEEYLTNFTITNWLDSLPDRTAITTARLIGTRAPVFAPMAACNTGIWAIAKAYELIQMGMCDRVIAGAVETPITRLSLVGFDRMGALAIKGCYPFDRSREGLVLGEGGAIFLLETAELARSRRARIYGEILGFGLTCDAYHLSAPELQGNMGKRAIEQCLQRSNLQAEDIDYIHAHGTSTQLNDRNEAELISKLFPQGVAVSSTKGSTGHTLGASGAIGLAMCLLALQKQKLPPCVGLREPDFDLDLVRETRYQKVKNIMCLSFGFGGQNGAISVRNYTNYQSK
jgi:3-oxoacyl-[acyl-carrier-protein] synthase II